MARQHAKDRKSHALWEKADALERSTKAAEKNRAVSSDDPEALKKLKAKVARLETARETYKRINAEYRKLKGDIDAMTTVSEQVRGKMKASKVSWYMGADRWRPFDSYVFQNMGAEIRRLKDRIKELEDRAEQPAAEPIQGEGFTISEDTDWGRILVQFDRKPPKDVCRLMRQQGWRWAPSRGAWVRHLNNGGRYAAQAIARQLPGLLEGQSV